MVLRINKKAILMWNTAGDIDGMNCFVEIYMYITTDSFPTGMGIIW